MIGFVAFALHALRDSRQQSSGSAPRPPVRATTVADPSRYWRDAGFVEMVPPVRPPTSDDGALHIVVYLKLPDGRRVEARAGKAPDRMVLAYPPGTVADRVEYVGRGPFDGPPSGDWWPADVRGTTLGAAHEDFHVYRPTRPRSDAPLVGLDWPGGDDTAQTEATRALGALIERGVALGPSSASDRAEQAAHVRAINGCDGCHVAERPARTRDTDPGVVNRGTDGSGFFQVSTVLEDRAPLETYRPRNANAGDRFMRFVCGEDETPAIADRGMRGRVRCPGGDVPIGVLDVRAALDAGDPHATRMCASRLWLFSHLDAVAQAGFHAAAAECGGVP
jgi:hypothetical protein